MQVALGTVSAGSQGVRPEEMSPKVSGQQEPRQILLRAYAGNEIHGHVSHLPEICARVNLASASASDEQARGSRLRFPFSSAKNQSL